MKLHLKALAAAALSIAGITAGHAQTYTQTNLVSNVAGARTTDPQLSGPFGMARSSSSAWWVANAASGVSTLYNGAGVKQSLVVTIPSVKQNNPALPNGTPAGIISNGSTTDFLLAPGVPTVFLFATMDGTIAGWNPNFALAAGESAPSTHAVTVVRAPVGSSYTGLTSAIINGRNYLYAANFAKGRVDVFDYAFQPVRLQRDASGAYDFDSSRVYLDTEPFADPQLPPGYVPFNVQNIGNDIVVTYAFRPDPKNISPVTGAGLGYVDIFSNTGKLLERLQHGTWFNAPWGVALAPLDFGRFSHELLIGESAADGSASGGTIAAFDLSTGKFDGFVQNANGKPLVIKGLLGLSPGNSAVAGSYDPAGSPASELYSNSVLGLDGKAGGLFGYLTPAAGQLTEGNDQ